MNYGKRQPTAGFQSAGENPRRRGVRQAAAGRAKRPKRFPPFCAAKYYNPAATEVISRRVSLPTPPLLAPAPAGLGNCPARKNPHFHKKTVAMRGGESILCGPSLCQSQLPAARPASRSPNVSESPQRGNSSAPKPAAATCCPQKMRAASASLQNRLWSMKPMCHV